jgi:ATP/maltotriose-dependent transcriptional regulator MalT
LIEEAIEQFFAAGNTNAAVALVEANMHAVIDEDLSRRTLGRWFEMFPPSAVKQQPVLLVAHTFGGV